MANRAMQQKAMKLQKQIASRPRELPATCAVTRDDIAAPRERHSTLRLAWAGDKIVRADDGAKQRKLVLSYAPAGEWTLHPKSEGKPSRW